MLAFLLTLPVIAAMLMVTTAMAAVAAVSALAGRAWHALAGSR